MQYRGDVQAPDQRAAEAEAVRQFKLSDDERKRLVLQERETPDVNHPNDRWRETADAETRRQHPDQYWCVRDDDGPVQYFWHELRVTRDEYLAHSLTLSANGRQDVRVIDDRPGGFNLYGRPLGDFLPRNTRRAGRVGFAEPLAEGVRRARR